MSNEEEQLDPNSRAILDAVSQRVLSTGIAKQQAVVDVGCGEGRLLSRLQEKGMKHLAGIGWAAKVPAEVAVFNRVDLSQAGWSSRLQGQRFDWVVSTEVIEHLINPFHYLVELRNIVAPGGRLLLTFPNVHSWRSIVGYAVAGRFSGFFGANFNDNHPLHDQHIFIPNMHLVRYFLKLAGFSITEVSWVNGRHRLTAQTTMVIAEPCEPVNVS